MIVSRFIPSEDLKEAIENLASKNSLNCGIIICMVGSLNQAVLRMSNGNKKVFEGPLEIVSAEGTIAQDGIHVHLAVSDEQGAVLGGHLLEGCIIHTTVEICILTCDKTLKRVHDPQTGYKELQVGDN
jgi:predicted DNA-binding protein with PD1-like motif